MDLSVDRRGALGVSALTLAGVIGGSSAQAAGPSLTGKRCVITAPDSPLLRAIQAALRTAGATVRSVYPADMTDAAYDAAFLSGPDRPDAADVVISIAIPERNGGVGKVKFADFRRVVADNYGRNFMAMKAGIPLLRNSGGGLYISITSTDGRNGVGGAAAASAAANGIVIMTKSAAIECASKTDRVRVNAILAGEITDRKGELNPGQVRAEDVASAVTYMVADGSNYLTGLILPVDNGGAVI
ncbi:MAG: SDR family oxidoreductase [Alphaproteobacteria bacterium]|nr:SDR family oxidoreductase [Alphaproteobacteria bacterium]